MKDIEKKSKFQRKNTDCKEKSKAVHLLTALSINDKTVEFEWFVKGCIMELHERGKLKGLSRKIVVVLTAAACTIMLISVLLTQHWFPTSWVKTLMNVSVVALWMGGAGVASSELNRMPLQGGLFSKWNICFAFLQDKEPFS